MAGIPTAPQSTADTLGAHLGYGRGCVMCHAPHSGAGGNGIATKDTASGNVALWGQDLSPLYGQALSFGGGSYAVTLPANMAAVTIQDGTSIILLCLSCHDGNLAKVTMMHGQTVESLPVVGGNAPTLLGSDGTTAGNYSNDHPVGSKAVFACGGQYNWDCTLPTTGNMNATGMSGPNSSIFVANYGFAVSLSTSSGINNTVTCTSCHNQHSETIYSGKMGGVQGFYQTMFFLKGYYNPTAGGNSTAQFCRQCHGGNANESLGQTGVPTT
jgi:hypothetical protein